MFTGGHKSCFPLKNDGKRVKSSFTITKRIAFLISLQKHISGFPIKVPDHKGDPNKGHGNILINTSQMYHVTE